MKKTILTLSVVALMASVCFGYQKGDILSYFNFDGSIAPFGIDVRETASGTELHAATGDGQVYQMGIEDVSAIKDGSQGVYNAKNAMMDSASSGFRGLALMRTYQGSYGWRYRTNTTNYTHYQSTWGYPAGNDIGEMEWLRITNAWALLSSGDIAPSAREKLEDAWPVVWTSFSGSADGTYYDAIFKYPDAPNTTRYQFTAQLDMPKPVQGVSLGHFDDVAFEYNHLWVLCQDGEILKISSDDGEILDRFYIDASITSRWGIAYDPSEKSLWISSPNSRNIYQIATQDAPWRNADFNEDGIVDALDLKIMLEQWLHCTDPDNPECDQYYN